MSASNIFKYGYIIIWCISILYEIIIYEKILKIYMDYLK